MGQTYGGAGPLSPQALITDGLIASFSDVAVTSVDVTSVGDEGGWEISLDGVFPTHVGLYVDILGTGINSRCFSGVITQGNVCWSVDGSTLTCVTPPVPVGSAYDIVVTSTDATYTTTLSGGLSVWRRSFTTNLYGLRVHHPAPRDVGPYSPIDEVWGVASSGQTQTPYRALISAIADTLYETSGYLLTRVHTAYTATAGTLRIEGAHRWPSAGRIAIDGQILRYTGLTAYFDGTPATEHYIELTGITHDDLTSPTESIGQGAVVMLASRDQTTLDQLRRSFLLAFADGPELDILARNHGLERPLGMETETFRTLLGVLLYMNGPTLSVITDVLDIVWGPTNYEVYTLHPDPAERHRLFVELDTNASDSFRGKTFLTFFETQTRTTATTVSVSELTPSLVNGVWDAADVNRVGINYAEAQVTLTPVAPDKLTAFAAFWTPSDTGKGVRLDNGETWTIAAYIDPLTVQVQGPSTPVTLNSGDVTRVQCSEPVFREWMVGHTITLSGSLNTGTYTITSFVTPHVIRCSSLTGVTEAEAPAVITPAFSGPPVIGAVHRTSFTGNLATTPVTMPVNVIVDYTTITTAQLTTGSHVDGVTQYPAYLFDETYIVQLLMDIITSAGIEPAVTVR